MKKKVEVKICTGTMCTVMGGSELLLLDSYLSKEENEQVIISGTVCEDYCHQSDCGKAPFAKVNGKIYSDLLLPKLVTIVKQELE